MKPDELSNGQGGVSLPNKEHPDSSRTHEEDKSREAAANVIRSQIDNLYSNIDDDFNAQLDKSNPYERTHTENTGKSQLTNDWQKYHSAWQNYYQKYYDGYYKQIHKQPKPIEQNNQNNTEANIPSRNGIFSTNEAVFDLRQKLVQNITVSANKIRSSHHFVPIVAGTLVMILFVFLQYNSLIMSNVTAYVSPGNIDPQNIVIDPNEDNNVDSESRLIIPKINVDVPVLYDVGNDYKSQMTAMTKGLAHFSIPGANSHPGEIGNTVLSGHSSNDLFDPGDYKFIFAQLDKLVKGDTVYANYKSKRYAYIVTKKSVVKPSEVNKLIYETNKPMLTLITCTPLGTALNRLLVTTQQVSPDPESASPKPKPTGDSDSQMPGTAPTLLERLLGAR